MQDKDYDTYFDNEEITEEDNKQKQLLEMVKNMDKTPDQADLKVGKRVKGTVLRIGDDLVFLDIGYKNEALIKREELCDAEGMITVKQGNSVEAFVVSYKNDEIVLSTSLSGQKASVKELIHAMKNKIPVDGKVTGINKGGFNVSVMGKKAFCPFSQIDLKHVDEPNSYLMRTFSFMVTDVENRGKNIVLSRLPILEKVLEKKIHLFQKTMEEKKVITGTVTKISPFGLFVDLGDIEGLVHISEISWDRADNLEDSFVVNQKVECVILNIEKKEPVRNSKISLSIRQISESPWIRIKEKLKAGSVVEGTVTRLTKFGAFVRLLPGVEGLVHVSEMTWSRQVRHPEDVVSVGDTVRVTILNIDENKQSVSCSLKDVTQDPWNTILEKYPVGSMVNGTIANQTKYGYFIDLDDCITGLLTHGRIAKEKKRSLNKGDTIEVGIDEIDLENRRIALSYGYTPEADTETVKNQLDQVNTPEKPKSEFGELLKAAFQKSKQ